MYVASSLTFGILLLFRASLAQSAPHMYPDVDEDEEALIDRLASLAAAVGPETLSRQMFSNYDLPQLGGYLGDVNGDMLTKEALASLPRQFAYRPDDPGARFYLPADQFPNYYPQEKAENFRGEKETVGLNYNSHHNQGERLPQTEQINEVTFSKLPPPDVTFMKKNQPRDEPIHPVHNIVADPSNMMSSGHSVEKPFHNLYPVDPENDQSFSYSDIYYIGIVAGCSAAAVIGLVGAGICWYRIHQRVKAAAEVDYPAYGVTGPSKDVSPKFEKSSVQMYHYHHQKTQIVALQKNAVQQSDQQGSGGSDVESEDDNDDDNDYTVYECPGLAPAGEMEVKNPLFQEDEPTPATPQQHMKLEDEK